MADNSVYPQEAGAIDSVEGLRAKLKAIGEAAFMDFTGLLGSGFDIYDVMQDISGWNSYPYVIPPWYRQNQNRGEMIPIYIDEVNLRFIRDRNRKLVAENPFCQCAIENLKNYAVGENGFMIRCVPAHKDSPLSYSNRAQKVVDLWAEANELSEIEGDVLDQGEIDGDYFLRHFRQRNGLVLHRPVFPEHVRSPVGDTWSAHLSFGVQCNPLDVLDIQGYHIVEEPIYNPIPAFVPAANVTHFKFNTPRSAKRGLPLFYSCELLLRDAVDLLKGVVVTANVRARIAVIRKFGSGIIKDAAEKMLCSLNQVAVTDPSTGQTINVNKKPFGSVVNLGANQELEFPSANMESDQFYNALQMVLRAIAARLNMPEWMLTADSSNTNYSSAMVAEAPSTKMFARLQKGLTKKFGENRADGKESLAWIQIKHAVRMGVLPPETLHHVKLQCEGPSLVARDRTSEANKNKIYFEMRVKSRQTIQLEQGLDPFQEDQNFMEDVKKMVQMSPLERELHSKMIMSVSDPAGAAQGNPPSERNNQGNPGGEYPSEGTDGHPPAGRGRIAKPNKDK